MSEEDNKYRSYAITVRPKDGITDRQVTLFAKFVRKTCDHYHVVTEKTGHERHLHAGLFLKDATTRSNFVTRIQRLFKDLTTQEKSVLRQGIKIMYNVDFINTYLDKDDDTVVIESSLPEAGHLESFFPPKPVPKAVAAKRCSLYYHELERLWFEHCPTDMEITTRTIRNFLFKMMYQKRCIPVIRDDKQIVQTARHLCRWLTQSEHCSDNAISLAPYEHEESGQLPKI